MVQCGHTYELTDVRPLRKLSVDKLTWKRHFGINIHARNGSEAVNVLDLQFQCQTFGFHVFVQLSKTVEAAELRIVFWIKCFHFDKLQSNRRCS